MTVVAVVIASFFAAIIIATRQVVRGSRTNNLMDRLSRSVVDLSLFVVG
jgi:hypothetical protein